jgi:ABC-type phosphate transport system substrate-binding protein
LTTLAEIYLGTIANWNHSAIRSLNPDLASRLPDSPIIVVGSADWHTSASLLAEALNRASYAFSTLVLLHTNHSPPHLTICSIPQGMSCITYILCFYCYIAPGG